MSRYARAQTSKLARDVPYWPSWAQYVTEMIYKVQQAVREQSDIAKLRFLLYPSGLLPEDRERIKQDDAGVV